MIDQLTYRDFEIHIRPMTAPDTYSVDVQVAAEGRRAHSEFICPFSESTITRALDWMERGLFDETYVKEFGGKLFENLFVDKVKQVYDSAQTSAASPLRFRFILDSSALARIPWELLYDPDRRLFLSTAGPFVRDLSIGEATRPLLVDPPLRMLVVDAFPQGILKVQNQVETEGIKNALAPLIKQRKIEIETLSNATLPALQSMLRAANDPAQPKPFHILHFIGHGQYDLQDDRTVLLFEDDDGQIDEVDAETLTSILRSYDLKLIFLNACQSMQVTAFDITRGFARALLNSGVPAVIGMQVTVLDTEAVAFSHNFYAAIAANRPVDMALTDARQLARGTPQRRKADLGIPVCYLRTPTSRIMEITAPPAVPLTWKTWWPWLRTNPKPRRISNWFLTIIGLLSGVVSLVQVYPSIDAWARGPIPMTGAFNIAVAEFGVLDAQGQPVQTEKAEALAHEVYTSLSTAFQSRPGIQVRPPEARGSFSAAPINSSQDAAKLADQINAHVIIYGTIRISGDASSFVPEFYLATEKLPGAEELNGQYELGSRVFAPGDPFNSEIAYNRLHQGVVGRVEALAQFLLGLDALTSSDAQRLEIAEQHFDAALPAWPGDGQEVLFLFRGIIAADRSDFDAAQMWYSEALEREPGYARAWLGSAEALFQKSRAETCTPEKVDRVGLEDAVRGFQQAAHAEIQPAQSDIQTKVAFFLGRAYYCMGRAGLGDYWDESEQQLQQVIHDYEAGDALKKARLEDRVANAYAHLGLIYLDRDTRQASTYERAADAYTKAIEHSRQNEERASYHVFRAHIYLLLRSCNRAKQDWNTAIKIYPPTLSPSTNYQALQAQVRSEFAQVSCSAPDA